jgi:Fe-S cluster assembly protein SufB
MKTRALRPAVSMGWDTGTRRTSSVFLDGRADLGQGQLSEDRLQRHLLLRSAERAEGPKSLDEVDPELLATYEKLGIPLKEQEILAGVASRASRERDEEGGPRVGRGDSTASRWSPPSRRTGQGRRHLLLDFRSMREHPELVKKYLGSVVPQTDNFYAALNSAVFTDGSFVYIPEGVRCPMELSTYFRINAENTGQFERTLIIADKGSYVSYLEGCTAPMRDENQLHAAVVELVALDDAEIKYSTVQNWYPGRQGRQGRHLQLRHQARRLPRQQLQDLVDPGRDRLGDHLEVPVLHPARRQFARRVLFDRHFQRLPAGRQRHQDDPPGQEHVEPDHLQGHRGGHSDNTYRGLVSAHRRRRTRATSPSVTRC